MRLLYAIRTFYYFRTFFKGLVITNIKIKFFILNSANCVLKLSRIYTSKACAFNNVSLSCGNIFSFPLFCLVLLTFIKFDCF